MGSIKRNIGVATLEFAASAVFLLGLITGGVGLVDYVCQVRAVNDAIDTSLNDDGVTPLTLSI